MQRRRAPRLSDPWRKSLDPGCKSGGLWLNGAVSDRHHHERDLAMFIRILPAALALTLPLAGCVVETVPTRPDLSTCTSNATHQLVGTSISLVNTSQLASTVRILPPNGIATMDYNPARLNISTDANGIITQVSCG
jgi:hypothetical protein